MRFLLSRALCCGWEEADCALLVEEWLCFHGDSGTDRHAYMAVDFYRELKVVWQYLARRGVLERMAEEHAQRELEKVARWKERTATRVLRLLAEHPGCRRVEVQRGLGLQPDALKRQLQRLERDGLVARGEVQGRYCTTERGDRFLWRLGELERGLGDRKLGTS